MTDKAKEWEGYYSGYFAQAARRKIDPLEVLEEGWTKGSDSAKRIYPYINSDSIVLEIACGIGRVSRWIAPRCKMLYCADIIDEALNACRANLRDFTNIEVRKISGYNLADFPADYFDCVFSTTAFFHFDFELVVLYISEIKRTLKSNGAAIIEFKRWDSGRDVEGLLNKIEELGGIQEYEKYLDKWRYVSKDMLQLVCDYYGLEVIDDNLTRFTFKKN